MKKLTLLLTSLLLAGVANAGFAEFTTDAPQVEEWQDFQIAHQCSPATHHHTPGSGIHSKSSTGYEYGLFGQGGADTRGHNTNDPVMCVSFRKIKECKKQNRVIELRGDGGTHAVCGRQCGFGEKPDDGNGDKITKCVSDGCPSDKVWQPSKQKCVPVWELVDYCKSLNQVYNRGTRKCEACPQATFPQYGGCKTIAELNAYCASVNPDFVYGRAQDACVSIFDLRKYCKDNFNKGYRKDFLDCFACPAGSFPQESGCRTLSELNAYCASTNSAFVYGVAQDACVSISDLKKYCRDNFGKVYNKDTAKCEACPAGHFSQDSGCVSFEVLKNHCNGRNEIYNTASNECERCPVDRPKIENNECREATCPANHYWQEAHNKCVAFDVLDAYCRDAQNKVYNPQTSNCICPNKAPFENRNGVCVNTCKDIGSYFVYHPQSGSCRNYCPPPQTPDVHGVCR